VAVKLGVQSSEAVQKLAKVGRAAIDESSLQSIIEGRNYAISAEEDSSITPLYGPGIRPHNYEYVSTPQSKDFPRILIGANLYVSIRKMPIKEDWN